MKTTMSILSACTALVLPGVAQANLTPTAGNAGGPASALPEERGLEGAEAALADLIPEPASALNDARLRYDPQGRRDPFVRYARRGRIDGGGLDCENLRLVGIMESEGSEPVAVFHGGAEATSHFLREGDPCRVGTLTEVDPARGQVVIRRPTGRALPPWEEVVIRLQQ